MEWWGSQRGRMNSPLKITFIVHWCKQRCFLFSPIHMKRRQSKTKDHTWVVFFKRRFIFFTKGRSTDIFIQAFTYNSCDVCFSGLKFFFNLFSYFWLCLVFVAVCWLSLVGASKQGATLHCGMQASPCGGFSYRRAQALECTNFSSCGTWA